MEHKLVDLLLNEIKFANDGKILDVGCGSGDLVHYLRKKKFDAYGIDVEFKGGAYTNMLEKKNHIRKINGAEGRDKIGDKNITYKWPIDSSSIDLAISSSVIEHVRNIEEFVYESSRIMKRGGVAIHYYPSSTALREAHTGIPLGAKTRNKLYYKIACKTIGTYSEFENNAERCLEYMKNYTFYRSNRELKGIFKTHGFEIKGDYSQLIALSKNKIYLYKAMKKVKEIKLLFNMIRSNLLILEKIK